MDARLAPIVASLLLCLAGAAAAQTPAPAARSGVGILTLTFENDTFMGRDRYYTSGQRVSWQSRGGAPGPLARAGARLAPWLAPADARVDWGVAVGQWMYTPRDRSARNPARDERPYAGQLAASLSLQAAREDALGLVELTLGVVGPAALAEETQELMHDWLGEEPPNGWRRQIGNRPVAMLTLERRWRLERVLGETLAVDLVPALGLHLGNVQTGAAAGALLRIGRGLAMDFGPPRMRPALSGLGFFEPPERFAGYFFLGVEARALAYDATLDGNRDGYWRVEREPLVGELPFGLAFAWRGARVAFTGTLQTRTFEEQDSAPHAFGSLSVSFAF